MNLKKTAGIFISTAVAVLSLGTSLTGFAEETTENKNQFSDGALTYEKIQGGVSIVSCESSVTELNISDKANGFDVIQIADNAFAGNSGLKSVKLPDSVESIGKYAFAGCSSLAEVVLPDAITVIPEGAFMSCQSLETLDIPETVTVIDMGAFMNCVMLNNIDIPESVISFEDYAFNNCYTLTSLELPQNLENIGVLALGGLYSLTELTVAEGNECFKIDDDILYDIDMKTIYLSTNIERSGELIIPDTVTSIEGYAFAGCAGITSLTLPPKLTSIGSMAFSECILLSEINFSEGLTTIGDYAFQYNESLESLEFPSTLKNIGVASFAVNEKLNSVIMPEGLTTIGSMAFLQCDSLNSITIPKSVETIGDYALGYISNEDGSEAVLKENFVMSVYSDSSAVDYATSNGIEYEKKDVDLKSIAFISICAVVLIITIVVAVRIMKKGSKDKLDAEGTEADKVMEEKIDFDDNYTSIIDESEE